MMHTLTIAIKCIRSYGLRLRPGCHTRVYIPRPMLNTDMDYLDLSANMLTGMLPAKLGELTDITYLNVSRNRLSVRDIH